MLTRFAALTIAALALVPGTAVAQSNTEHANANGQSLPQQITQKLKDQGFTNVEVVPGSYLVSAKDKQGDPVTMIIGPHSMTVFTVTSAQSNSTEAHGGNTGSSKNK